jgi:fimbrial chaperone protein
MSVRRVLILCCAVMAPCQLPLAHAAGFAAVVSPPRFELKSRNGATLHQVFSLTNGSNTPAKFRVHTADFTLGSDYGVNFQDALQPGSCRPWVALERPEVPLPPGGSIRYRFEVQVPKDAPPGECRFGILIEGDRSIAHAGSLELPIAGRIGIIVYVIVGGAKPAIDFFGPSVVTLNGQQLPALRVHNGGDAHARMGGFLYGTDAKGIKYDFNPSTLPILPGEVRQVYFTPSLPGNDHPTLTFPVTVQGKLEWDDQSTELNEHFE